MMFDNIKKTVNYSFYLIIVIVILTWIDHYDSILPKLKKLLPLDEIVFYPIAISILSLFVLIVIHIHNSSMIKGLNLTAFIARSSQQTRQKLDHLLENIQESIMIIEPEGKIIYYNEQAKKVFALPRNSIDDLFCEDGFPINIYKIPGIQNCLMDGQVWEDTSVIKVNGQKKTIMHRVYPLSIKQVPEEIVVISTDISELVEASKNAESANLSKSQFLANMTHELRTPMIGVLGSTELLSHTSLSPEQYSHLNTIRECGEQLLNIINDILDLSKIDLGINTLSLSPVNLARVVEKTAAMLDNSLRAKGLQLNIDIDPSLPPLLLLDEQKFRQVLVNLLVNAIKFTFSGQIDIKAVREIDARQEDWLLVSVQDTGIGIPEDKLYNIFGCFTQADSSSCREYGGAGLGLYICEKLVNLMSGNIRVTSQEGQGTTFSLRIPLKIPDLDDKQIHSCPPDINSFDEVLNNGFLPIRILLVEDNELNQKLIIQMLLSYGFEVEFVNNGLECLHILEEKNFNLILMDMQMPIMDGYEATRIIRANCAWDHIPIIAITANAMSGDREKCLECGCASYLAKPFKADELVQEIKLVLQTAFVQKTNNDPLSKKLIADLMPEFLATLEEMLQELKYLIQNRDMNAIQHQSHAIKGTAGMYGFVQISEIAALMEQACRDKQYPKIPLLFNQLCKSCRDINTRFCSDIVV